MSFSRFLIYSTLMVLLLAGVSGCNETGDTGSETNADNSKSAFEFLPVYGDGMNDLSEAVAQVGDIVLTEKMLDLRFSELQGAAKNNYEGEGGRRLLLNQMIDETIMVLGAADQELYNLPEVAELLLVHRRITLDSAMRNLGLIKGNVPNEDQIRDFYLENKDKYRRVDVAKGRHVECLTREDADQAYERLLRGGAKNNWPHVVNDLSHNVETKKLAGEFGWFNQGSFLPQMADANAFTSAAIGFDAGLHEPIYISGRWHVIEILKKEFSRTMTFAEARPQAEMEMLAGFQDAIIKDYLRDARKRLDVSLLGEYAPGNGLTTGELFDRGMMLTDPLQKISMLSIVFEDFPEDERADDALYWVASTALDIYPDRSIARRYLNILMEDYPTSELVDQAQFLLDNMDNPKAISPASIEELRRNVK
jgi:hypothetical protein